LQRLLAKIFPTFAEEEFSRLNVILQVFSVSRNALADAHATRSLADVFGAASAGGRTRPRCATV
jgi:hypothetical protein